MSGAHSVERVGRSVLLLATLLAVSAARVEAQMAPEPLVKTAGDPLDDEFGSDLESQGQGFPDPLEGVNRGTLKFNQGLDHWVLHPMVVGYRFVIPDPGRRAVRRFFANLNSPAILVNDILQLEFHDAGVTTARFLVNSTAGIGGLFDVGESIGLEPHRSDFGQTLARAGVGSGPFIMLPIFGPTTLRDGSGAVVDFLFRPTTYVFYGADQIVFTSIQGSGAGLVEWDTQSDNLHRLEDSSIDYYAALRSAYYQNRMAEIRRHDELPASLTVADE
jgi:phospholipid-binding lipoprotein MlaA